jgi:2-polyprenyl-6-methoxyphenol hydroxylase-like FAD-dependent oxidoreductase
VETAEFEVVVVGAGPTGLFLAAELSLYGCSVLVVERLAEPDRTIKAGGIGALGAEALARRGLGPALDAEEATVAAGMAQLAKATGGVNPIAKGLKKIGGHFSGLFLIDQSRQREPERRFRAISQISLERHLGEHAQSRGVTVWRETELSSFTTTEQAVEVTLSSAQGERRVRAQYLVGCDGGRSRVRKLAGFEFPGTEPTMTGHQAIVTLDHPERLLPLGWRRTPHGMMAFGPVPGRIFMAQFEGPPADRNAPVTREELEASLRHVSGADVRILEVQTATRFTDNARQATTYRLGRVLLAGDAAHVHSPFGGQGLNLGLMDASNLGWKLAATVRGTAPPGLLDTYTAERHPVAAAVLENTRAQLALMRPDFATTALRNIVTELMELDEGNRYFGELVSGVRARYDLGSDEPLVGCTGQNYALAADAAAPNAFALMADGAALLVDGTGGAASALCAPYAPRVTSAASPDGCSYLLRPDACVAWTSANGSTEGLSSALERWFGAPLTRVAA